jgi:hypothetical protein
MAKKVNNPAIENPIEKLDISPKIERQLNLYNSILPKGFNAVFTKAFVENDGDLDKIENALSGKNKEVFSKNKEKLLFTGQLQAWNGENEAITMRFIEDSKTNSMRDIALQFNQEKLFELIKANITIAEGEQAKEEQAKLTTTLLHTRLFQMEPNATLVNMIKNPAVPLLNDVVGQNIAQILEKQADFNLKTTSVYELFKNQTAFEGFSEGMAANIRSELKILQRITAISPVPDAIPVLHDAKLHTASQVADIPLPKFKILMAKSGLNEGDIAQLHFNAQYAKCRNEQVLMSLREASQPTSIGIIDKSLNIWGKIYSPPKVAENSEYPAKKGAGRRKPDDKQQNSQNESNNTLANHNLSWDLLFGDADFCECGECTSVYSAAAYYVELLQYLRNNNLDPLATETLAIKANPKDIRNTPLEKLFARRPDLGCLELTCKNTNTILPYIDLVNEVMEHYVAFKKLKPFNVADETSGELLAEAQHTEYEAYCTLKDAVYPFTLPYHQPIDATRIYLHSLDTSRHELIDTFRKNNMGGDTALTTLQDDKIQRAADAEFLGITQEEFKILTKACFESQALREKRENKTYTTTEYQTTIGIKPVHEYYGLSDAAKLDNLQDIKKEFLPRTSIDYANLVDLLKTEFVNPLMPKGKSKAIMESLHFNYRFLQQYVKTHGVDKMAEDLVKPENFAIIYPQLKDLIEELARKDKQKTLTCPDTHKDSIEISDKDIKHWVKCHFEKIGKLIVIEKACVNGEIVLKNSYEYMWAINRGKHFFINDCKIRNKRHEIGFIDKNTGEINFKKEYNYQKNIFINECVFISDKGEKGIFEEREGKLFLQLPSQQDSCNLDTAILKHLDGTPLELEEYDRIHRFIRLWRKMGWTIDETDKAIVGLSATPIPSIDNIITEPCNDCADDNCSNYTDCNDCDNCEDGNPPHYDINPELIHQLVAVKKLLDKTGLDLIKLLSFWSDISTKGEKSLYQRLFLTHNLLAIDKVFKADATGNFLSADEKITAHLPVLMAAFNLSAEDIEELKIALNIADDKLTLGNISAFYRHRLLAKVLGLRIPAFLKVKNLFGDMFMNAYKTLEFMDLYTRMEDAGFDAKTLNYIIQNIDDDKKPFVPSEKTVLQMAKTLYDGLNMIDEAHKDLEAADEINIALLSAKASLLFDNASVEKINNLIEGTTVFMTNAPKNLTIVIPSDKSIATKLKYDKTNGAIQITGILTDAEKADFEALSDDPAWLPVLQRIEKQQVKLFKTTLEHVFEAEKALADTAQKANIEANEQLLKQGDIKTTFVEGQADLNTASQKMRAFLAVFLPYLRRELAHRFVVATLSNALSLSAEITDVLISKILETNDAPPKKIYRIFEAIKASAKPSATNFKGYLIPSTTSDYTFVVKDSDTLQNIVIEGKTLALTQQEDPTNEWWSETINLQAGKLYEFSASIETKNLHWKTPTGAINIVPIAALLPDFASDDMLPAFVLLKKVAMLINGFNLSADEIVWLHEHKADFDNIDFGKMELKHFFRLEAYTRLRNSLSQAKINMLDFWKWTNDIAADATKLSEKIAALTTWQVALIDKLIADNHFKINQLNDFKNEINLLKLQKALNVADKIGMDINLLFDWAVPTSKFKKCREIADSIRNAIRTKYKQTDWEEVVKPLHDQLRHNQKNALIAYLLQKPELIAWGVTDAEGLFEYFLIDVQMEPCMETSRIKQAINSVQLFVQRCFLGLEEDIEASVLDRGRWEWLQRYRVWEANRKVFLYPENWIESNLRDDKSPFFKELESELLQKDINKQNVSDALKNYLYKVDEVANMEVVGLYIEGEKIGENWSKGSKLHVFSRTRNAPYFFYYRYLALDEMNWYAWEKVQVDIPSYDTNETFDFNKIGYDAVFTKNPSDANNIKVTISNVYIHGVKIAPEKPAEYDMHNTENNNIFKGLVSNLEININGIQGKINGTISCRIDGKNMVDKFLSGTFKRDTDYNGCYLTPVVWNGRLLIFFPQFIKKTKPSNTSDSIKTMFNKKPDENKPTEYYEIKMAWSEYRNGKWTQKQISKEGLAAYIVLGRNIADFTFIPIAINGSLEIRIEDNIADDTITFNSFSFNGSSLIPGLGKNKTGIPTSVEKEFGGKTIFQKVSGRFQSLQLNGNATWGNDDATFTVNDNNVQVNYANAGLSGNFYHPHTRDLLGKANAASLQELFAYNLSIGNKSDAFGAPYDDNNPVTYDVYNELKRPYSLYNWELFFHTPMTLANELSKAQHFEEAMKWYHYVFNPFHDGADDKRFWQFSPFKETDSQKILDNIFNSLQPNTADSTHGINEWRNKPFMPHVVARNRPVAYMKWVVMKYLDNLMAWGDYLFRQDTIESINQATQLYILAGHILGPRPMMTPKRGEIKPQTYMSLLDKWDAFSNAVVELELAFPFSNQTAMSVQATGNEIAFANIYGFSSSLYFCIPNNPKLMGYWDTIADRLFKIRHCLNIEGVFRKLPLFEPPIDPALLVNAAANGLSIASVLNDLNTPMPNYRFYYLLQKALELCGELKSMGGAMLAAIEKKDGESIGLIRAKHESIMHNLVMDIKKKQLEEAQKSLDSLLQNRKAPEARMKYYLKLSGLEDSLVPTIEADFNEIANDIVTVDGDSGLKLIKYEKEDMDKSAEGREYQIRIGQKELLASILHMLPSLSVHAKPLGIGLGTQFGGSMLGSAMQASAKYIQNEANGISYAASNAGKKGSFTRALQERIQQANAAGYEIKQIDKQIISQQIRIEMANLEIRNQQQMIDNANEVEEFLKNKYTNEELYTWMRDNLKTLYHQVYSLAYELAKKAEKTYRFERGLSSSNFIQSGYWNAGRDGLLSGEQLYVGLKQLEAAYQENRGYDYEITKHISLRQINPLAVLQLRESGKCEFVFPELLFDMDYPGHYKRRIKSLSISIPCIAGPYTGINATLRLLENKFRNTAMGGKNYTESTEEADTRFMTFNIPITAIAASTAQNDSGMFELNFKDERYLPFEGAGCISKWRLELPTFRQFDYNSISDAVIHIRYTSVEGGEHLGSQAKKSIEDFMKTNEELTKTEGLFSIIDLKHDLATEWHKAIHLKDAANPNASKVMNLDKVAQFIPFYANMLKEKMRVTDIIIATDFNNNEFELNEEPFSESVKIGALKTFVLSEQSLGLSNWKLTLPENLSSDNKAMMILRFTINK